MATFLQLAQAVARDSGTVAGTQPSTVVSQTGRLGKIVQFTAEAWVAIQNTHNAWRWMRTEFPSTAVTTADAAKYTPASWNIQDHAEWICEPGEISLYLQSSGRSDENDIPFVEWSDWRRIYDRGSICSGRPTVYTISPANEFCFGPVPDGTYRVRGEYRKTPQVLAANSDIPEMPARFHDLIKWRALVLLAEHDEAPQALQYAAANYGVLLSALERDQLPRLNVWAGGPLA